MAPFLGVNVGDDEGLREPQSVVDGANDINAPIGVQQIERVESLEETLTDSQNGQNRRKRILVVGLGMVAISFMYVVLFLCSMRGYACLLIL